ncbi:MAG: S-layer homology domain-containing protein, partial [Actinomycetota bacterium]
GALDAIDTLTFRNSIAAGNDAIGGRIGRGGALYANTQATVEGSALINNEATADFSASGSAVNGGLAAVITNSTVTANSLSAPDAAGAVAATDVTLIHATVADNRGATASGVFASGTLISTASVVSDQESGEDDCLVLTATVSHGHNYATDASCGFGGGTGDVASGADPGLGQHRNNSDAVAATEAGGTGAPRTTMFPLNGSPLIDAIPAGSCSAAAVVEMDQRGIDRPFGGGCDIGAIEAVFPAHGFTDSSPFYEATIRWVTSEVNTPRILNGFPDNTFGPGLNIIRGDAARLYYRAAGAPDVSGLPAHGFTDVPPFYEDAVRWVKANGVFDGFGDNTFRHQLPINRGNYTRSLYAFAGSPDVSGLPAHGLTDVTAFYENAVRWAKGNGLADGFPDNTYRLGDDIVRGNASRIFYNTAQSPAAWDDTMTAPANMLFRNNLLP